VEAAAGFLHAGYAALHREGGEILKGKRDLAGGQEAFLAESGLFGPAGHLRGRAGSAITKAQAMSPRIC